MQPCFGGTLALLASAGRQHRQDNRYQECRDTIERRAAKPGADDEKLKKLLEAQLKELLDKGVRILKNTSPNLSLLEAPSRNGSSRNGSAPSRKAAAATAKAGKK